MNRTAIRILNGALAVLCCFLAARTIASVAGEALAPEPVEVAALAPRGVDRARSWQERERIVQRALIGSATAQADALPPPPEEDLERTKLPLRLLGTAASADAAQSRAAVEDLESRIHYVVRVGDLLKDQAKVVRIERRRIVLENAGRREELALAEEDDAAPRPVAARPAPPARRTAARPSRAQADIQRLGENRFALPRADVESMANNPAALFSQARILPKYEEGAMVGVQLNAIKPGSLFEQIGIQNGDVVTAVNGIQVTGQQESAEVLRELAEGTNFDVTVTGPDGQQRQLSYEIQ